MNKQKNYRRRQRGITPITTPRNSPGVAQFSMSEVAQFSVSLDTSLPGVLSCRLAVSEIRSVQAKLCHHIVQAVGLLLP